MKSLAKVCSDLISGARAQQLHVAGPVRLPTRTLRLCVRKSPNEEGTNTYDRWEMRVHKRLIDLHSPSSTWPKRSQPHYRQGTLLGVCAACKAGGDSLVATSLLSRMW